MRDLRHRVRDDRRTSAAGVGSGEPGKSSVPHRARSTRQLRAAAEFSMVVVDEQARRRPCAVGRGNQPPKPPSRRRQCDEATAVLSASWLRRPRASSMSARHPPASPSCPRLASGTRRDASSCVPDGRPCECGIATDDPLRRRPARRKRLRALRHPMPMAYSPPIAGGWLFISLLSMPRIPPSECDKSLLMAVPKPSWIGQRPVFSMTGQFFMASSAH